MDSRYIDELLAELVRRRFTLHYFGLRSRPHLIGATLHRDGCVDVLILRGPDLAAACRVVAGRSELFAPSEVVWHYLGSAALTMRALFAMVPPSHPAAPWFRYPAPESCRIPPSIRRPVSIRPF
ncbi:hypothetical protein F0L68_23305 [Solihabitans fulvus]|uniref:Uncharacterized protein n=1 Tax=Solihabitans fulvus TaxID=1892852 RepID=A0A5B2X6J8_9PSEU|nr:hypothetical protein [Solihabitans fulvus]KAA2258761.1 hypothetical protein F0L68_23305 [Solihabitans fulvus]